MFEKVVPTIATENSTIHDRMNRIMAVSEAAIALEELLPEADLPTIEHVGQRILREFNEAGGFDSTSVPPATGGNFWYVVQEKHENLEYVYKFGITSQSMKGRYPELATERAQGIIVWQLPKDEARNGPQGPFDRILNDIVSHAGHTSTQGQERYHVGSIEKLWQLIAAIDGVVLSWGGNQFTASN